MQLENAKMLQACVLFSKKYKIFQEFLDTVQGLKVPCSGAGKWGDYKKGSIKRHANATKFDDPLQTLGLQMIPNP